jgi:hypothetical protein
VNVRVSDVRNLQASTFDALLETGECFIRAAPGRDADILDANLPGEYQILLGEVGRDLKGDLDARRQRLERPSAGKKRTSRENGGEGGTAKIAAA